MPSGPKQTLRIYLATHDEDQAHAKAVCLQLQRTMEHDGFTVWHPGLPLPGDNYAEAMCRERERADLRVMLLSVHLLASEEFTALCALPPGLAIHVGPCDTDLPGLRAWRLFRATPVSPDTLYAAAQEIRQEISALRKELLQGQAADPPPGANPVQARVERLAAEVTKLLDGEPELSEALARQPMLRLAAGTQSQEVARVLVWERSALAVATAINAVDLALEKSRAALQLRRAARRLLFQLLPLATNWRSLLQQGWGPAGGARSVLLPFDRATLAEVVVAGIDERLCRFSPCEGKEMPIGYAAIRVPAAARAPLFDVNQRIDVEAMVRVIGARLEVDYADLNDDALRRAVRGRLRHRGEDLDAEDRLPYYLLFEPAALGSGTGAETRWTLARERLAEALPSLRLVRLTGGVDEPEDTEARVAETLNDIIRRGP